MTDYSELKTFLQIIHPPLAPEYKIYIQLLDYEHIKGIEVRKLGPDGKTLLRLPTTIHEIGGFIKAGFDTKFAPFSDWQLHPMTN